MLENQYLLHNIARQVELFCYIMLFAAASRLKNRPETFIATLIYEYIMHLVYTE